MLWVKNTNYLYYFCEGRGTRTLNAIRTLSIKSALRYQLRHTPVHFWGYLILLIFLTLQIYKLFLTFASILRTFLVIFWITNLFKLVKDHQCWNKYIKQCLANRERISTNNPPNQPNERGADKISTTDYYCIYSCNKSEGNPKQSSNNLHFVYQLNSLQIYKEYFNYPNIFL